MIRALFRLGRRRPLVLATLLALALTARLAGATLLAPSVEGWVAICSGGQVVHVRLSGDGVPAPDRPAPDRPAPEPCKGFGLVAAALPSAPPALPSPPPAASAPAGAQDRAPARGYVPIFHPRGPPQAS